VAPDPSISRLARDATSAVWHLNPKHHVCDVTLRNVPAFDVSHGSRLSELWPLRCDVICLFTYQKRRVLCPKM